MRGLFFKERHKVTSPWRSWRFWAIFQPLRSSKVSTLGRDKTRPMLYGTPDAKIIHEPMLQNYKKYQKEQLDLSFLFVNTTDLALYRPSGELG